MRLGSPDMGLGFSGHGAGISGHEAGLSGHETGLSGHGTRLSGHRTGLYLRKSRTGREEGGGGWVPRRKINSVNCRSCRQGRCLQTDTIDRQPSKCDRRVSQSVAGRTRYSFDIDGNIDGNIVTAMVGNPHRDESETV